MPVSRVRTKMVFCPGCGLRCWAGIKRLMRHMRNQCSSKRLRLQASIFRGHKNG